MSIQVRVPINSQAGLQASSENQNKNSGHGEHDPLFSQLPISSL
jgi:hypothetical protein